MRFGRILKETQHRLLFSSPIKRGRKILSELKCNRSINGVDYVVCETVNTATFFPYRDRSVPSSYLWKRKK